MTPSTLAARAAHPLVAFTLAVLVVDTARADPPPMETLSFNFEQIKFARPTATLDKKTRTLAIHGTDGDDVIVLGFRDNGVVVVSDDVVVDGNIITGGDWYDGLGGPVRWVDIVARVPQSTAPSNDDVVIDGRIITSKAYDRIVVHGHAGNDVLIADTSHHNVALIGGAGSDILCSDDLGGLTVRLARLGGDHGAGDVVIRNGIGPKGGWSEDADASVPRAAYFVKNDATTTTEAFLKPSALTALDAFAPLAFASGLEVETGDPNGSSTLTVSPTPNAPIPSFYDAFFVAEPDGPGDSLEIVIVENGDGSAAFVRSRRALVVAPRAAGATLPIVLVDGEPSPLAGWVLEQPIVSSYSGGAHAD